MLCIGNGRVIGVDIGRLRYKGSYTVEEERVKVEASLTATRTTSWLVTGATVHAGQSVHVTADWPMNFGSGELLQVMVGGRSVSVRLEKVGDIEQA